MFIVRNSEGVHAYLLKCFRGTCSSVGMLKGYMVRERLGTPVLDNGSGQLDLKTTTLLCCLLFQAT